MGDWGEKGLGSESIVDGFRNIVLDGILCLDFNEGEVGKERWLGDCIILWK